MSAWCPQDRNTCRPYLRGLRSWGEGDDRAELVCAAVLDGDVVTVGTVFLDQVLSSRERDNRRRSGDRRVVVGDGDDVKESVLGRELWSEDANCAQLDLWRG